MGPISLRSLVQSAVALPAGAGGRQWVLFHPDASAEQGGGRSSQGGGEAGRYQRFDIVMAHYSRR